MSASVSHLNGLSPGRAASKAGRRGIYSAPPRPVTGAANHTHTGPKVIPDTAATDTELMERTKTGDRQAFSALSERHAPRAWRIAVRFLRHSEDAEEAVQDAFTRVWVKAQTFDDSRASFSTWFYTILTRQCLDRLRRRKPHTALSEEMISSIADEGPSAEAGLIGLARQKAVRAQVDALPERQRAALILCYFEGVSQAEAARIMNVHIKALEGLLHRAKLKLKEGLASLYDAE